MRFIALMLACVGVLLAVAGCDPVDKHYFTRGVGTDLYPDDVANQTNLQNAYVANICRQAGLVPTEYDGTTSCGSNRYDPAVWWQFVQAGMNDIDRRCDAYLTWLDNVRRSREPILNQISQTGAVTQTVLAATGVGVDPMAIVAAAFGLASSTVTNVNSRLITELDHSTVQAVVLSKQTEYRNTLIGDAKDKPKVIIASRPAAIYALRSYLRLCMPMTIETEINNTVATIARSGPDALNNKQPLISANSVGVATITNPNAPTPHGPKAPKPLPGSKGPVEEKLSGKTLKAYQRALCVEPDGKFGPDTRAAVSEYLKLLGRPDKSAEFGRDTPGLLQDAVDAVGSCRGEHLANVFEVVRYGMVTDRAVKIRALQEDLNTVLKAHNKPPIKVTGEFIDDSKDKGPTRNAIAEVRKLLRPDDQSVQDTTKAVNRALDPVFLSEIAR